MKLNLEQIKSVTCGAETVWELQDGFHFSRFSEEEIKLYSATDFRQKSFSAAGIELCFKTNSPTLKLKVNTAPGATRSYFSIDVWVNGEMTGCIKNFIDDQVKGTLYPAASFPLGEFEGKFNLAAGESTVRIVLPWSVKVVFGQIELADGAALTPIEKSLTLLMYGDSITHGYDALYSSNSYAQRLAQKLNAALYNKAIGGEVFFPQLAKLKSNCRPDLITVAYGTNDWNKLERAIFEKNCREFYENLTANYPHTPIFAITPIWRREYTENRKMGEFSYIHEFITDICSRHKNITVIKGFDIVPKDENLFGDFRLHPNDEGFAFYADAVYAQISRKLKEVVL